MRSTIGSIVAALVLAALSPVAGGNHGTLGYGTATLLDGSTVDVLMRYESGDHNRQTWAFNFVRSDGYAIACKAVGSVENGFNGNTCPTKFTIGGTGEYHANDEIEIDEHTVAFSFGASTGTLRQSILSTGGL